MARSGTSTTKPKSPQPPKKKVKRSKVELDSDQVGTSSDDDDDKESGLESDSSSIKVKPKSVKKGSPKKETKKVEKKEKKGGDKKAVKSGKKETKVKKGKRKAKDESDDEDEYNDDDDDEEDSAENDEESDDGGRNTRVVRTIQNVPAPKASANTSLILPTTMEFLAELRENNDREWFATNDARYRHAFANFKTFLEAWVTKASEADWQLPHLPTKDLVHRIYRDVRFSKNKTPYKTNLAFSHSRTGRKGPFAFYYFQISPGGKSLLAAGCWQPQSTELKAIRNAILRDPQPLRDVISTPEFVELYGSPKPRMDGKRTSIFGLDDQLKNAPKMEGVDKNHKDIDLLKCRSFAVETHFDDAEVLEVDFLEKVIEKVKITAPFVQLLNEFISPSPPSDDEDEDGQDEGEGDEGEEDGGEEDEEEDKES